MDFDKIHFVCYNTGMNNDYSHNWMKAKRQEWKALNLCLGCGKIPPVLDMTECQECHDKHLARASLLRETRRLNKLCVRCGKPAIQDKKFCQYHLDKAKEQVSRRQRILKASGLCLSCGNPSVEGKAHCREHLDHQIIASRKLQKAKLAKGLCKSCGPPRGDSSQYCDSCLPKMRKSILNSPHKTPFDGMREPVLKRDNYQCVLCRSAKGRMNVHHIDKQGYYTESPNNSIDNLVTLCNICHVTLHYIDRNWHINYLQIKDLMLPADSN